MMYNFNLTIDEAIETDAKYFGVAIDVGLDDKEIIINTMENMLNGKISYYVSAYTEDLKLKANESIQIVAYAFGDSFEELEKKLLKDKIVG